MSPDQLARMQAGRARHAAAKREQGYQKVCAFRRWLQAGSPRGSMPAVPTDADYAAAWTMGLRRDGWAA